MIPVTSDIETLLVDISIVAQTPMEEVSRVSRLLFVLSPSLGCRELKIIRADHSLATWIVDLSVEFHTRIVNNSCHFLDLSDGPGVK